jgi:hypothetical protein
MRPTKLDKTGKKETVRTPSPAFPRPTVIIPSETLVEDSSGALYGVASGGDAACGVVFKVAAKRRFSITSRAATSGAGTRGMWAVERFSKWIQTVRKQCCTVSPYLGEATVRCQSGDLYEIPRGICTV